MKGKKCPEAQQRHSLLELGLCWDHLLVEDAHNPDSVTLLSIKHNMLPMFVTAKT
jgi:hypothetical protein